MQTTNHSILTDTKWVLSSLFLARFLSLAGSVVIARLLGPFLYGTWRALRLILFYSPFLQLGLFDGVSREIPFCKGRDEFQKITEYKSMGMTTSLLVGSFAMMCLLAAPWVFEDRLSSFMSHGLQLMAIVIFFNHIYGFYRYYLVGEGDFALISRMRIMYAAGAAILHVIGVLLFGITGLLYSLILINFLVVFYLVRNKPIPLRVPKWQVVVRLVRTGIPMLLNGMSDVFFYTVDRLMILAFLGKEQLGLYSVALLAGGLLDHVPAALQTVLLPRIAIQAGAKGTHEDLRKFWLEPLFILAYVMPLIGGLIWIVAPTAIKLILPKYTEG
ncbi:MAG: oligosaccharide flippase family protein, partial [Candidatus Hodarchaeales archaeon]